MIEERKVYSVLSLYVVGLRLRLPGSIDDDEQTLLSHGCSGFCEGAKPYWGSASCDRPRLCRR